MWRYKKKIKKKKKYKNYNIQSILLYVNNILFIL